MGGHVRPARRCRRLLLAAGWVVFSKNQEENWEHGDSISYDLQRRDEEIEVEQYEFGRVVVYPLAEDPGTDDGFAEPLFALNDPSPDECRSAFQERGWLG